MVLVDAELAIGFVAMSIVSWLRYPVRSDDDHLAIGRFLFPIGAAMCLIITVAEIGQPAEPVAEPVLLSWVLGIGVVAVGTAAWAVVEVRHYWRRRLTRSSNWPLKR